MTTLEEAAPRSGWYHGWNIIWAGVLAQVAVNGLVLNSFSLFLHNWSVDLNSPISTLQIAFTLIGVMNAANAVMAGAFADKYPVRLLICGGLLAMAVSCFAVGEVTKPWHLILLYAIPIPIALSYVSIPVNAIVSRWFIRRRGLALGLTTFGLAMAGIVLPPIIATVMPEVGWRMIWRTGGLVIGLVILPIAAFVLRDHRPDRDGMYYMTDEGAVARPNGHRVGGGGTLTAREVFRHRNFWLMVALYLPMIALYGVGLANLGPVVASRNLSPIAAGYFLSAFSLAHAISTILMGVMSDRFGNRRPMVGLAFVVALGGVIIAFGYSIGVLGLGVVFIGLGGGVWPLLAAASAEEFGTAGFGRAFGLLYAFLPIISITPVGVAKLQEVTGSYVPSLLGLAALTVAGGIACSFMHERRGSKAPVAA